MRWLHLAARQPAEAINLLLPIRTIANRFGGSHAQRDLIHLTLVEAALQAGQAGMARALIAERTQLKPSSPFNWQLTARALELNGDDSGAAPRTRQRRGAPQGAVRHASGGRMNAVDARALRSATASRLMRPREVFLGLHLDQAAPGALELERRVWSHDRAHVTGAAAATISLTARS